MFCHPGNTREGKCVVRGDYKSFKTDTVYENPSLIGIAFVDTQMICKTTQQTGCSITIKLSNPDAQYIAFVDSSKVEGSHIYVNAPSAELLIDDTSYLMTTGRSLETKGTSQ